MSKSTFFTGQPLFTQLLNFIPRNQVNLISRNHHSEHYCKKFTTYSHLVTLLYAVYNRCRSLRERSTGMLADEHKLNHLGLNHVPRRSTLSDANTRRKAEVFESIYQKLYQRYRDFLPDSRNSKRNKRSYVVDSTSIALFQEVLKGTGTRSENGKRKGGIKVHTLMRLDEDVPQFIKFSARAASDSPFLKSIHLPKGSILIFDRGYNKYSEWNRLDSEHVTWITRLRKDTTYCITQKREVSSIQQHKGVISDHLIDIGNTVDPKAIHVKARLITYIDHKKKKTFEFITNNMSYAATTIADFYRKRWQIEILFKRIKQNYPLGNFLGDTENAIKIQIWATLIADLILKVIKNNKAKKWAFSNLVSMVRLHLMTYIDLFEFLKNPDKSLRQRKEMSSALSLFPT